MCRLYAFKSNEPTRVECSLVHSQNALMAQSAGDAEGLVHGHGWGIADFNNGLPLIEKQTWAAFHGEHFSKKAARVYAHTVIAHVRRATVGEPAIENTHPFEHGRWIFAHNGTIHNFAEVSELMVPEIDPMLRNCILGTTDSEYIFYYVLTLANKNPEKRLLEIIAQAANRITEWSQEVDPQRNVGLNMILTDGDRLAGTRLGRTLWHLEREAMFDCDICGKPHVHHVPGKDYRAIEFASEPLTDENWHEMPDKSAFEIDSNYYLLTRSLH